MSVVTAAQIAVRLIVVFISADRNSAVYLCFPGCNCNHGPQGICRAESLKATQEELSPAEERLSSSPSLHLWRLAYPPLYLPPVKRRELLGGFGWEWRPTLHLDTVNALKGLTGCPRERNGEDARAVELCRQEQDDTTAVRKLTLYLGRLSHGFVPFIVHWVDSKAIRE